MAEKTGNFAADNFHMPEKPTTISDDDEPSFAKVMRDLAEKLRAGFDWADTEQGYCYWSDVMDELLFEAERQEQRARDG